MIHEDALCYAMHGRLLLCACTAAALHICLIRERGGGDPTSLPMSFSHACVNSPDDIQKQSIKENWTAWHTLGHPVVNGFHTTHRKALR